MRPLYVLAGVLLASVPLAGCNAARETTRYEITGPNQVVLEVPGMT